MTVDSTPLWHAPGIGEVHFHDHSFLIFVEKDAEDSVCMDDVVAQKLCEHLNATGFKP